MISASARVPLDSKHQKPHHTTVSHQRSGNKRISILTFFSLSLFGSSSSSSLKNTSTPLSLSSFFAFFLSTCSSFACFPSFFSSCCYMDDTKSVPYFNLNSTNKYTNTHLALRGHTLPLGSVVFLLFIFRQTRL